MPDTADLQAQLRALEEQLERKRLEEEIAQLQLQLANSSASKLNATASNPVAAAVDDTYDEEEYEEEEYIEEYDEEEYEEEVIIEIDESEPATPPTPVGTKRRSVRPTQNAKTLVASAKQSTAPDTTAMYDELRLLEEELQRRQLQEDLKALEQQAAAMNMSAGGSTPKESHQVTSAPRSFTPVAKPSGPFKQRVIPNIEASPAGEETPMELLMGPKLYKDGKLVATTTRAACEGQQLMLLFFAASWNRLCKPFFPKFLDFYKLVNQAHGVECIYISTDRNLNEFKEAFSKMPYVAMPTGTAEYKNRIAKELKILEVPFLVVVDVATAHVITTNGVDLIDRLERGNWEQANSLVEDWKRATPVPLEQVQLDTRLVNGVMERGILYWHN